MDFLNDSFINSDLFTWVILPLLIFIARVADVSVGTLRIAFITRGKKIVAPFLGFLEIIIWLLAIGQIFKNLNNVACYIAYAFGFAFGNFVGIWLESKLALGEQVLRIITRKDSTSLTNHLKSDGYGVTTVDGEGASGPVKIIFIIFKRKDLRKLENLIKTYNPKAFYSVEDVRLAKEGIFPKGKPWSGEIFKLPRLKWDRKGK